MKKILYFLIIVILIFISCEEKNRINKIISNYLPKLDSSTSTHPLIRKIACDIFQLKWEWYTKELGQTYRTIVPIKDSKNEKNVEKILSINPSGTHGAYVNLIDEKADLIIVARAPSQDELDYAKEKNKIIDSRPVAMDAFVFISHVDNPIETIDIKSIHDIYTGKITKWSEINIKTDTDDDPIHAYQRNRNSGSQELMQKLVMKELKMIDAPNLITNSMIGPFNAIGGNEKLNIAGDRLGLGYTVYFYAKFMFPHDKVKMVKIENTAPTYENIASKKYPFYSEVYVAITKDTKSDEAGYLLREWLFTKEGQKAISESGYVPIK
ncbi:MAG: substrate-binding domain-containing protein [Chitinispirillia bacterium]|jgi:phosphate transport system substrate-binding protein